MNMLCEKLGCDFGWDGHCTRCGIPKLHPQRNEEDVMAEDEPKILEQFKRAILDTNWDLVGLVVFKVPFDDKVFTITIDVD